MSAQVQIKHETFESYQGAVPHPALVEHFSRLYPDAAATLFRWAEQEIAHRHAMDSQAMQANIATQAKQVAIAEFQAEQGVQTDRIGLFAGIAISLICIGASVYLALSGQAMVAMGVIALPTAGVLLALRGKGKPALDKPEASKKG